MWLKFFEEFLKLWSAYINERACTTYNFLFAQFIKFILSIPALDLLKFFMAFCLAILLNSNETLINVVKKQLKRKLRILKNVIKEVVL